MAFHGDWSHRALLDEPDYPEVATVRALPFTAADDAVGGGDAADDMPGDPGDEPAPEPDAPAGCGEVDYAVAATARRWCGARTRCCAASTVARWA
ncbi:MAG: hypothetical protein U0168_29765 [Nannocystaceae bacterium]